MTSTTNPDQFQDILHLVDSAIAVLNWPDSTSTAIHDLRWGFANKATQALVGVGEQALIGQPATILFPLLIEFEQRIRYVTETGETHQTDYSHRFPNQETSCWYRLILQKHGNGLFLSLTDISSFKRNEQSLKDAIEHLKQSNQSLEQFAYVASHDLQEPLRKIQSFGDMLRNQQTDSLNDTSLDLIHRMQSAAQRMNELIQDLLTFSRLSSEKQSFKITNLQEVVDDVLADLEATILARQAKLSVTSLPTLMGNAGQLRQLFQNLLSNALKFVYTHAIPDIRIDCQQVTGQAIPPLPGQLVTQQDWEQPFYAISVIDNGIGFDSKYVDRIFLAFQRLHTRNEYQGTGVGLSIVQKVVENHHGYLGVESRPGSGSIFTVYLPAIDVSKQPEINL